MFDFRKVLPVQISPNALSELGADSVIEELVRTAILLGRKLEPFR